MPWTVIIAAKPNSSAWAINPMPRDLTDNKETYGFLVSEQTVMAGFNQMNHDDIEVYRIYAGPCYSKDEELCKFGRGLLKQKALSRSRGVFGDNGFEMWKIEKVTITQHLKPICLWNLNTFDRESSFDSFVFTQNNTRSLKRTELLSHQQCYLNISISTNVCNEMDSLMCSAFEYSGIFLVTKVDNRYYLRATRWGNFLLSEDRVENRILWYNILQDIDSIFANSTGLFLMPPTPKLATEIDFGTGESYAGCGEVAQDKSRGRERRDTAVVGFIHQGTDAPIEQNPWHASLSVHFPTTDSLYDICGGTLVSKRVIVTAAHCLYDPNTGDKIEAEWLEITLGMYDATNSEEIGRQLVQAASIVIYDGYDYYRHDFQHDLALIIMKKDSIQITERVRPACLWNSKYDFENIAGKNGKVVGFGFTEKFTKSNILQKAYLRIAPHEECFYSNKRFYSRNLRPTQNFCAGFPHNGTNACNGDSGGGLLIANGPSARKKRFYLRGVISFVLDSSVVFPDGLWHSAHPRFGHFERCLAAPSAAKYCMVAFETDAVPVRWVFVRRQEALEAVQAQLATCVPASCNATEAVKVATLNLAAVLDTLGGRLKPSFCFEAEPFDAKAIAFACFTLILFVIVLGASFSRNKAVSWLSAQRNVQRLFSASSPGTIHCVHSIRSLSICWVMLGHKIYTLCLTSPPTITSSGPPWVAAIVLNGYLSVDTFLLMSALLSARAVAKARRLPLLPFYLLRYLRLLPPLAFVVFFYACFSTVVAHGPLWPLYVQNEALYCRGRWWSTLIFLNNYIDVNVPSCLSNSWFLSVDMQLVWLSPLVLFPLLRWLKFGIAWIITLLVATTAAIFALTLVYDLPWTMSVLASGDKIVRYWELIYTNTPLRAQPYLIGLLLGFFLERPVRRLPPRVVASAWFASLISVAGVVFTMMLDYHSALADSALAAAFYASIHKIVWSCSLAWIIFACHKGYGGPINKFLSLKLWVPLSRLTYCTFLVNLYVMTLQVGATKADSQFSVYTLVILGTIHI
ncbi:Hypothetical predicted protein [Cloeon dipterum]|uniref:Peptidase S1 domain-containing protein n=1 Tax=Cloeon dipterum TaxID=197152 RepID=A0A8S1CX83_9INSE|nr:Hypothetical predicted protein [Cloeon dipterum]